MLIDETVDRLAVDENTPRGPIPNDSEGREAIAAVETAFKDLGIRAAAKRQFNGYSSALMGFDFADADTLNEARYQFSKYLEQAGLDWEQAKEEAWKLNRSWEFAVHKFGKSFMLHYMPPWRGLMDMRPESPHLKIFGKYAELRGYDHKFSTTQVNLPQDLQNELQQWVKENIAAGDLHPTEKQEPPFHVTVKYGLNGKRAAPMEALLTGWGPITLTLGSIDTFTTDENYDVLIVRVQSPDLIKMNHALSDALPNTDTQSSYRPHAMLAYLKKGSGDKWVGNSDFNGRVITVDTVQFGSADDDIGKTDISLAKSFTCAYCGIHRYHLPGEHDQCDHSPTGECVESEGIREGSRANLFKEERRISGNRVFETAFAFDDKGNQVLTKRGDKSSVGFTKEEIATMKNTTFTHNHPQAVGLSPSDVRFAADADVSEMRAVGILNYGSLTGAKVTYIIKRPPQGWPKWETDGANKWLAADKIVRDKFTSRIAAKKLTVHEADNLHHVAANALYAQMIGAEFRTIRVKAGR